MNLLRFAGRTLLASYFIVNGARAIADPAPLTAEAEPVARAFVPLAQQTLPPSVSAYVPEDTRTLVRLNGLLALAGGLGMATGLGRRVGAGLAAVSMVPHLIASDPRQASREDRSAAISVLLRNAALLGAALVASQDTQGNPSLVWRANDSRLRLAREAGRTKAELTRDVDRLGRKASRQVDATRADLAKEARRLRTQAAQQVKSTQKSIEGALS